MVGYYKWESVRWRWKEMNWGWWLNRDKWWGKNVGINVKLVILLFVDIMVNKKVN